MMSAAYGQVPARETPSTLDGIHSTQASDTSINHNRIAELRNGSRKLLIIDDQAGVTRVVATIAAQLGLDVKILNSSLMATETFLEYQPDIVLLDMIMPEKDGIDVLNEILLTGMPTRLVLTSGLSESYLRLAEGVARFHENNQVTVLKKPFRRDDLISALQFDLRVS